MEAEGGGGAEVKNQTQIPLLSSPSGSLGCRLGPNSKGAEVAGRAG